MEILKRLKDSFKEMLSIVEDYEQKERGFSLQFLFDEFYRTKTDSYVDIINVDVQDQYIVYQDYFSGESYRTKFELGDTITFGEHERVDVEYVPRFKVFRDKDNTPKFMSISSTAILNRVNEIDSTALYDDFEENYPKQKEKAYLTIRHLGDVSDDFRFGTVEGVFRENKVLITYGTIDETKKLGKLAIERLSEESNWGVSIGFRATKQPQIIRENDLEIPVYTNGILLEVSILRENEAASYMTNIGLTESDTKRMAKTKEQIKSILSDFGASEDAINGLLNDVEIRNREIEENDMITRDADTKETIEEETQEEVVEEREIEIDDTVLEAITRQAEEIVVQILETKLSEFMDSVVEENNKLREALEQRVENAVDKPKERVVYKPTTSTEDTGATSTGAKMTMAEIVSSRYGTN